MGVEFLGRVRATVIEPGTELPYPYTAGEDIAAKEIVCKGESDGRIYKARADSWARMPAFGATLESKAAGQTIKVIQFGTISGLARTEDFSYDDYIYVSTTAGKATKNVPSAVDEIVQSIGRAINASDIILQVDETVVQIKS